MRLLFQLIAFVIALNTVETQRPERWCISMDSSGLNIELSSKSPTIPKKKPKLSEDDQYYLNSLMYGFNSMRCRA
jgi:hypothetical protein